MIAKFAKNKYFARFDNLIDLLDEAKKVTTKYAASRVETESRTDWSGTRSFDEAAEIAVRGWDRGVDMIPESDIEIPTATGTSRFENRYEVAGDMIDMDRFMSGHPETFIESNLVKDGTGSAIKKIYVDISYSSGIRTRNIKNLGLSVMAGVDAIESAGFRTEIILFATVGSLTGSARSSVAVTVKNADEAFNREKLVFCLAHPSFFRRLIFAIMERIGEEFSDYGKKFGVPVGGYGRLGIPTDEKIDIARQITGSEDFDLAITNEDISNASTVEAALKMITSKLKENGID